MASVRHAVRPITLSVVCSELRRAPQILHLVSEKQKSQSPALEQQQQQVPPVRNLLSNEMRSELRVVI